MSIIRNFGACFASATTLLLPLTLGFASYAHAQDEMSITDAQHCLSSTHCDDERSAAFILAKNNQLPFLINLSKHADFERRSAIVMGIGASHKGEHNGAVLALMTSTAAHMPSRDRFSDAEWYALQYLAERCDQHALQMLKNGGARKDNDDLMRFEVSSEEWAASLRSFGHCHYYPSRGVLIRSIGAANIDAGAAAYESLEKLYPHVCTNVKTSDAALDCFTEYFKKPSHNTLPQDRKKSS